MKKPDCYKCKYRGEVPGSAHSSCKHPKANINKCLSQGFTSMLIAAQSGVIPSKLKVKGNPQGIKGGWFCHPINFDPVWLEECDGFKKKK